MEGEEMMVVVVVEEEKSGFFLLLARDRYGLFFCLFFLLTKRIDGATT